MQKRIRHLIIGAGPTGLAAARQFEQLGVDWKLVEAEAYPGGLSASFAKDGYTWDLGGHVVFSHYDAFDRMLDSVLTPAEWLQHDRRACVRVLERWIPYPFQNNIRYLPDPERQECLSGLRRAATAPPGDPPRSFQEWIDRFAGEGIARLFLNPYNCKVWAYPPSQLSARWMGERVAKPDVDRIEQSIRGRHDNLDWGPNTKFRFPAHGGTGRIWAELAARLPARKIRYGLRLTGVDLDRRIATCGAGEALPYDNLITTVPLDAFVRLTSEPGLRYTDRLLHNSVYVVGVGFQGSLPAESGNKSWIYFPEPEFPFYRVTILSRYSPCNAPAGCYSLMAEVAESPMTPLREKNLAEACIRGFRRAGLAGPRDPAMAIWQRRVEYGYPVPSLERDAILSEVLPALEKKGTFSRGRFGAWKYEVGNMDHSFAQGLEIAGRLAAGIPEVTVNDPDWVNTGGKRTG